MDIVNYIIDTVGDGSVLLCAHLDVTDPTEPNSPDETIELPEGFTPDELSRFYHLVPGKVDTGADVWLTLWSVKYKRLVIRWHRGIRQPYKITHSEPPLDTFPEHLLRRKES